MAPAGKASVGRMSYLSKPCRLLVTSVLLLLTLLALWQPLEAHWVLNEGARCVLRGVVQRSETQLNNCLPVLQSALSKGNVVHGASRLIALVALETDESAQALALLDPYQSEWASDPFSSYRLLLAKRRYTGQVEDLSRWRGVALSQFFFYEAFKLRAVSRYDRAIVATELAYLLDSGWNDEWSRGLNAWIIGKTYHQAGQLEAARQAFEVAIPSLVSAEKPLGREYVAYAYRHLGEIAEQRGDLKTAFENYVQSILTSPQHADFFRLSDLMLAQGRNLEDVYAVLAELRQRGPQDDPYLWARSASVFRERNVPELAQRVLDEVPPELVATPNIRGWRAQLAADRGDLQTASEIYRSLLEEARSQGDGRAVAGWANSLAGVVSRQGDNGSAILLLEEATKQMPSVSWYWFNLGQAYQEEGMLPEARGAFQKALGLEPDYTAAAEALVELGE